jgi:hypothetical protein
VSVPIEVPQMEINQVYQVLLSEDILCLAVKSTEHDASSPNYIGLFDVRGSSSPSVATL